MNNITLTEHEFIHTSGNIRTTTFNATAHNHHTPESRE
jgi:hypothetical protein